MTTVNYTNYTNLDARFMRGYERGDRLVKGYSDEIDLAPSDEASTMTVLEWIFARHNRDDRPDGRLCPSMSVGDVVVLGETAWTVEDIGFARVDLDPGDLITDKTWTEVR